MRLYRSTDQGLTFFPVQASIRLANTCRLHRLSAKQIAYNMQCFADGVEIPKDYRSHYVVTICPPKDGIELGERVWTFWGAACEYCPPLIELALCLVS